MSALPESRWYARARRSECFIESIFREKRRSWGDDAPVALLEELGASSVTQLAVERM
jgi:hypothetical protein